MFASLKRHLPTLTVFALALGIVVGLVLHGRLSPQKKLDEDAFIREVERGSRMPVILRAENLPGLIADRAKLAGLQTPPVLERAAVIIPDVDAAAMIGCTHDGDTYFSGLITHKVETFNSAESGGGADGYFAASVGAFGTIFTCTADPDKGGLREAVVARGQAVTIPIHDASGNDSTFFTVKAYATYFDFIGGLFFTFLLMLFIPTLALALLDAVLDAAGQIREFRAAFLFFLVSSLLASGIGVFGGLSLGHFRQDLHKEQLQNLAAAFGGISEEGPYDPHPFLTQLGRIVPSNPLGALSDPTGNSGLQIAFVAVVIGLVLASYGRASREAFSGSLRRALSVFVKDDKTPNAALSEFADWAAPVGVFSLGAATMSKLDLTALQDLADLVLTCLICLAIFAIMLLIWIRIWRNWSDWFKSGLKHSGAALATAFGTSSSYASLPNLAALPLVEHDSKTRGILNFGITLNKSGTAVYIGAAAGFMLARYGVTPEPAVLLTVIFLCTLASTACAGLPFAAVFALRMTLGSSGVVPTGLAWLILPIDPILDRFVTVVNVFANICACASGRRKIAPSAAVPLQVPATALEGD
jgi:Na+/H+-dicarboxylate symporter